MGALHRAVVKSDHHHATLRVRHRRDQVLEPRVATHILGGLQRATGQP